MVMRRQLFVVILTILALFHAPVLAQDAQPIDYAAWGKLAERADTLTSDDNARSDDLDAVREQVVDWRARFQDAQDLNGTEIARLRDQIDTLGPVPAEGETEDAELAARRKDLTAQLAQAQMPRVAAAEALSQSNAIVETIDEVIRHRQNRALVHMSPSPLLPGNWALTAQSGVELLGNFTAAVVPRWSDPEALADTRSRLPVVGMYLAAAILLLTMGRSWVNSVPSRLSARASTYSRAVVAFITSFGQIVIPMAGIYLAIGAIKATGLPGGWTTPFLNALPIAGVILFGGTWLARQIFPRKAIAYASLVMSEPARNAARRLINGLSAIFAIHHILSRAVLPLSGVYERVGDDLQRVPMDLPEEVVSVGHFLMIVVAALAMYRLGHILRRLTRGVDSAALSYRHRILSWAGTLTRLVAIVAVLGSAAGFITFGNVLIWPTLLSLALIGLLILLQDFTADLFVMLQRGQEGARDGLAPLLIGFALVLISVPFFMMIWGARDTDLFEYWTRFQTGATFGGISLSPGSVLTFIVIFAIGYSITRAVQGAFRTSILPKTKLDSGGQNAIVSGLGYLGIVLAALMAITSAGIDLSSLAIVAGALSVGIGFGMQNIISNFVSGIILLIERPISVGDWISAGGQQGIVKRISVRSTQVETFDKTEVIVPNSDLISQPVTNWTRHNQSGRIIIPIGVAYGTDTRKVERILREIIEDQPIVTIDPRPSILFRAFGTDSLEFEIRAVLSDVGAGLGTTSDVLHAVALRFGEEGIELPFAQRDIWLRNPETLHNLNKPLKKDGGKGAQIERPRESAPAIGDHDRTLTFDGNDDGDADGDR